MNFNKECCICYEKIDYLLLDCFHIICNKCLCNLIKKNCPICRREIKSLEKTNTKKIKNKFSSKYITNYLLENCPNLDKSFYINFESENENESENESESESDSIYYD